MEQEEKSFGIEQWVADVENKVFQLEKQLKTLQEKEVVTLNFKKLHPDAQTPVKANKTDMCFDLFTVDDGTLNEMYIEYDTGIAFDIPEGYDIQVYARSSISKYDLVLCNGVGNIDNGYKNSVKVRVKVLSQNHLLDNNYIEAIFKEDLKLFKKGERICQFRLVKKIETVLNEVEELSDSERGLGGFGSSGV